MGNVILDTLYDLYVNDGLREIVSTNQVYKEQEFILAQFLEQIDHCSIWSSADDAINAALTTGQMYGFYDGLKVAFNIEKLKVISKRPTDESNIPVTKPVFNEYSDWLK